MNKNARNILVVVLIFAVFYVSGLGSTVFNASNDAFGQPRDYISQIVMQEEQATIDDAVFKEYAVMLMNKVRFSNGNIGHIPYFYGAKANDIDPTTGIDRQFGQLANGTDSQGNPFYKVYGLDCSGYTHYVMYLCGIRVFPHGSSNQYTIGASVPLEQGQTGDLLIYRDATTNLITHIGFLLVHNGKYYDIHCNSADNGIAGRQIDGIGTKADGYYWQEVVKNPYVTHD